MALLLAGGAVLLGCSVFMAADAALDYPAPPRVVTVVWVLVLSGLALFVGALANLAL